MTNTDNKFQKTLHQSFKDNVEGKHSADAFQTESVTFDGGFGNGKLSMTSFEDGISVIDINGLLFKDVSIDLLHSDGDIFHFMYVTQGHCLHNYKGFDTFTKIESYTPVLVGSNNDNEGQLILKKDVNVKINIISINASKYFKNYKEDYSVNDEDFNKLTDIFAALRNYLYECSHNLNIVEDLETIEDLDKTVPVTYKFKIEQMYKMILADYISQIYTEFYEERVVIDLTRTELEKVKKITDYIVANPGTDLSLDFLCSQVIMSQSKLQKGFKCVHNTTVSNYIRDVRLEKAKDLLLNSDLNVSEIVYSVGFTSRSYFCKIFKHKYGQNPTTYRSNYKDDSISANVLDMK